MAIGSTEPQLSRLEKAERLKLILRTRATGGLGDEDEYRLLRRELVLNDSLSKVVPSFLRTCRTLQEFWEFIQPKFAHYDGRRNYLRDELQPLLDELEERAKGGTPVSIAASARLDSGHVHDAWNTALTRVSKDPDGAITAARALLEAVCKRILDEAGREYGRSDDLPALYERAGRELGISPSEQVDDAIRRMMGAAQQVVVRISALRNLVGDAHGKGQDSPGASRLHAELAVNLAGSVASFMIASWDAMDRPVG